VQNHYKDEGGADAFTGEKLRQRSIKQKGIDSDPLHCNTEEIFLRIAGNFFLSVMVEWEEHDARCAAKRMQLDI
jgi:hypothetical protein